MGKHRFDLALRTIVVSTRAAVKSHNAARRHELADASIELGLVLLEDLRSGLPANQPGSQEVDEARRELTALHETAQPVTPRE